MLAPGRVEIGVRSTDCSQTQYRLLALRSKRRFRPSRTASGAPRLALFRQFAWGRIDSTPRALCSLQALCVCNRPLCMHTKYWISFGYLELIKKYILLKISFLWWYFACLISRRFPPGLEMIVEDPLGKIFNRWPLRIRASVFSLQRAVNSF